MLKRASFWLAMALSVCAIGGLATISPAATHKKPAHHVLKLPKAAKPLLKECTRHHGKYTKSKYSKHVKLLALHFLIKYGKTPYSHALSACERNLAKELHIKLPKRHSKKKKK